jgi:hypothetical protein
MPMLLLLIAAAVQTVSPPLPAAPIATVAKEKKVCQIEEDVTSRIRYKKICMPQSEWDAVAKQTQDDLNSSRNDRGIAPNDP